MPMRLRTVYFHSFSDSRSAVFFNNFFRVACQSFILRNLTWLKYNLEKQLISMGKQNLEVEIIEVKRQGDLFF